MLVFLFFVCTTTLSYAQHMVSGVVKDVTGEPIIGANVVEKGDYEWFHYRHRR